MIRTPTISLYVRVTEDDYQRLLAFRHQGEGWASVLRRLLDASEGGGSKRGRGERRSGGRGASP